MPFGRKSQVFGQRVTAAKASFGFAPLRSAFALVAIGALAGCGRGPVKPEECTEMLEHYVDMVVESDPQLARLPPAQLDAARAIKRAIRQGEVSVRKVQEQCEREIRRHEYKCAMGAKTPNDWEACID